MSARSFHVSVLALDRLLSVFRLTMEASLVGDVISPSKALDHWAYDNNVTLDFSRPGKPTDNPYIESFNGSFRDECLNLHWFLSLEDAQEKFDAWRRDYNSFRPHSSLGDLTPDQFAEEYLQNTPDSLLLTG